MYGNLALLAAFTFLYSLVAKRLEQTWVSGAIIFTAFGLIFGPDGAGILDLNLTFESLRIVAELTLALVLFTDAANANLAVLKRTVSIPGRLLLAGLPFTIVLGWGIARLLFPEFELGEAAVLATMLAPTDAALGKPVVVNPQVPDNIRQGLNVESGLNDGICVPILLLAMAIATHEADGGEARHLILSLPIEEIGIGVLVGASAAIVSQFIGGWCLERQWISATWLQWTIAALAVTCFATAQILGGSGFIASFVGGLMYGGIARSDVKEKALETAEGTGDFLSLITWVAFGATAIGPSLAQLSWAIVLYGLLSLTLIRMVPVFLCLFPMRLSRWDKLFMGWFGPRGLASVVFAVMVANENLPHGQTITAAVGLTIVLSIIAHGLTANPLANLYRCRT